MLHRSSFTRVEAQSIRNLLGQIRSADRASQKALRGKLRKQYKFYISAFSSSSAGFTTGDFDALVDSGRITVASA